MCVSFFFGADVKLRDFFFFSSRRRHTRFKCDWSSDVCSSDLGRAYSLAPDGRHLVRPRDPPMKFLCVDCDQQMAFGERELPGDGTLAATFKCPTCGRVVALLTNPMETQLVSSLGVVIGGKTVPAQPLETVRTMVATGRDDAFEEGTGE